MAYLEKFLNTKYAEFLNRTVAEKGEVPSQADFAKWLTVPPASYSQWSSGQRAPTGVNLDKLAAKLGPEVYDILKVPPRLPDNFWLRHIAYVWHELTDEQQERFAKTIEQTARGEEEENNKDNSSMLASMT